MVGGLHTRSLVMSGSHMMSVQSGSLTQTEDGNGQTKVGYGYHMSPGVGQHITTADGCMMIIKDGYGSLEPHGPPHG